jgi:hypothetical protein
MLHDFHQPQVSRSDWQKFDREFSPLIDEVIDRREAKLPDWLVWYACGSSLGEVLAMSYLKTTPSKAKKSAQARWREARAKKIEKLAKKAGMTKSQRNSATTPARNFEIGSS